MTTGLQTRTSHVQVFRLGQVVAILQMSVAELTEHLGDIAQENPFLTLHSRKTRSGPGAPDMIEQLAGEECIGLYNHVFRELAGLLAQGGLVERLVFGLMEELEPSGWLARPLPEIAARLGVSEEVMEIALTLVQKRVMPVGLFARDLRDCLRLQLADRDLLSEPMERVLRSLDALERGGTKDLIAATGLAEAEVRSCLSLLRRLNPKPGSDFCHDHALMREPDVRVVVTSAGCEIEFRSSALADVTLASVPERMQAAEARETFAQARALKRVLDLRRSALEQVVRTLVERQATYFRIGPEGLCPLTLSEIATATGFHVSTVSRVLNGLLIEGPAGIVDARSLCAAAASAQSGHSKPKVMARIRALVGAELPGKPLSDGVLTDLLNSEGIQVSRRVVAKYRQELGLPPASERSRRAQSPGARPSSLAIGDRR